MSAAHADFVQRGSRPNAALGTRGPEAVQITGLIRFRQPCFLDITYTPGYVSRFLPGTFVVQVTGSSAFFELVAVWSLGWTGQTIFRWAPGV